MTVFPFQLGAPKRGASGLKLVDLGKPARLNLENAAISDIMDEYVDGGRMEERMECHFREKDNEPKLIPTGQALGKDLQNPSPVNDSSRISRTMIALIISMVVVVFAALFG